MVCHFFLTPKVDVKKKGWGAALGRTNAPSDFVVILADDASSHPLRRLLRGALVGVLLVVPCRQVVLRAIVPLGELLVFGLRTGVERETEAARDAVLHGRVLQRHVDDLVPQRTVLRVLDPPAAIAFEHSHELAELVDIGGVEDDLDVRDDDLVVLVDELGDIGVHAVGQGGTALGVAIVGERRLADEGETGHGPHCEKLPHGTPLSALGGV